MNVFKKTLVVNTPGFFGEELLELLRCSQEVIIFMEDVAGTKELLHKLPPNSYDRAKLGLYGLDQQRIREQIIDADAVIYGGLIPLLSEDMIKTAKKLKYIGVHATGYQHVPLKVAKEQGIIVTNIPDYASTAVAEYIVGQVLNLYRGFYQEHTSVLSGNAYFGGQIGKELSKKAVGIIGLGNVGQKVAEKLSGFDCRLIYYSRTRRELLEEKFGLQYVGEIEQLVEECDIITLHVPLTPRTHNLFSREIIYRMKPDAVLINTGREEVIDNEALMERLRARQISAVIDVGRWGDEQFIEQCRNLDNVQITPHMAFNTVESADRKAKIFIENVYGFLNGKRGFAINEIEGEQG
jgi:phosphoglycerate dehydrogenase-like enzyme